MINISIIVPIRNPMRRFGAPILLSIRACQTTSSIRKPRGFEKGGAFSASTYWVRAFWAGRGGGAIRRRVSVSQAVTVSFSCVARPMRARRTAHKAIRQPPAARRGLLGSGTRPDRGRSACPRGGCGSGGRQRTGPARNRPTRGRWPEPRSPAARVPMARLRLRRGRTDRPSSR